MSTVLGDPGRLEAYTEATVRAVPAALHAVARYGAAVRAYNAAAPNDLGTTVNDNSTPIGAQLDLLAELDRAPAAFAFALRHLDRLQLDDGIWLRARTTQQEWFDALTEAWLDDPYAPVDQLLDDARRSLDTSLRWPWNGGALRTDPTTPQWWSGTAIGTAATAVDKVWREWGVGVRGHHRGGGWVAPHGRWRPGWADRLNPRIGRATTWRRVLPYARWTGRALPLVPGVLQLVDDLDDPTLTTGDRIARTATTTVLEGGGGVAGGVAGAKLGAVIGTAVAPGVGTVVGAVAGGVLGGMAGSEVGGWISDNVQGLVEEAGDALDAVSDWGGDALDTVTDWGDDALDTATGWGGDAVDAASDLGGDLLDGLGDLF